MQRFARFPAPSMRVSTLLSSRVACWSGTTATTLAKGLSTSHPLSQLKEARPAKASDFTMMDFGGCKEPIWSRKDWPLNKVQDFFKKDTLAVIGYGSQGYAQSLNCRDNGINVVVGVRKDGSSWKNAIEDGWVPGKNLFDIEEAIKRGSYVLFLLSDAAQTMVWPKINALLSANKTLVFSHGFSAVYTEHTKIVPRKDMDVILVAPKGSGRTVRSLFLEGRGINSSIAVKQDVSGKAEEKAVALGMAIGSGFLFKTTFEKEVYSDLVGERGVLMGALNGLFLAQYQTLRENGHSPAEAFNETVEEATESLVPLIGKNGMDYMFAACSTTARRGAIDWTPRFYEATKTVFEDLYNSVRTGAEAKRSLDYNSNPQYEKLFEEEMQKIRDLEIWRAGETVRKLRPDRQ